MDYNQIPEMLDTAREALAEAEGAYGLFQKIRERIAGQSKRDDRLSAEVSDLANELVKSRMTQLDLVNRLMELQSAMEKNQKFEDTLSLYAPLTLAGGGMVLALRSRDDAGQHFELVCPNCVGDRQKFIPLQPAGRLLECPSCKAAYSNEHRDTKAYTVPVRRPFSDFP